MPFEHLGGEGPTDAAADKGLAPLLRAWRLTAGLTLGRNKALSQKEVAEAAGVSERWYRSLEGGGTVSLPPEVLDRLAEALSLGADERLALYAHALRGSTFTRPYAVDEHGMPDALRQLVESPLHVPAYLTDHAWNVIGHNAYMATWFPWVVRDSSPNLLRWALTSPEARTQLANWHRHAEHYLAQLRFGLLNWPDDPSLDDLLEEVLEVPECRRIWQGPTQVLAYRQGHRFRLRLPHVSPDELTVASQVLLPAFHPGVRFVMLLPQEGGRGVQAQPQTRARGGAQLSGAA
ncbi:helix-turn-helix domain-containing protein [Streptomyces sp. NPDC059851]|uniref:helix-turn-helix domain-containing protein n=1 Tax=Streptomyces sp. NPDC059851 TaxID=3346971 RepID=UPI00365A6411